MRNKLNKSKSVSNEKKQKKKITRKRKYLTALF